ncbi:MAG: hypothetical protein ACYSTL_02035, partial [Planctomycetota bacterium]
MGVQGNSPTPCLRCGIPHRPDLPCPRSVLKSEQQQDTAKTMKLAIALFVMAGIVGIVAWVVWISGHGEQEAPPKPPA